SMVNVLLTQMCRDVHTVLNWVALSPMGPSPVFQLLSSKVDARHPSAGSVSVYFTLYVSSSPAGTMVLNVFSGLPNTRYTVPSTFTRPVMDWLAPVQWCVVDVLSVSENDQMLK